jgi:branched-chain amino acid transport system substrate-binding protein
MLTSGVAYAQDYLNDPVFGLRSAMQTFQNHEYGEAYKRFSALATIYPNDSRNSVFNFMATKSLYEAGDYAHSDSLWDSFMSKFPTSRYLPEAHLFKGHCLYKQNKLIDAADEYLLAIEPDPHSKAAEVARNNLMPLVRRGLTMDALKSLVSRHPISSATEPLEFEIARQDIDNGHYRKGIASLQAFMLRFPGSREFKQAKMLIDESRDKAENQISIGLLAPVTGSFQEFGRSMVEGARLALKGNKDKSSDVELSIKDTGSDPIVAAKVAREMADEEPMAVVGPLNSEAALSAAIVLNERSIPMITPTASESGLSSIGPYVFQISPSIQQLGTAMGQYAVKNLKMNEVAIIAPDDADGRKISNAFAEVVYRQGGEVIFTAYYPAGATDFKAQIMPLHDILVARAAAQLASGKLDSAEIVDAKTHELLGKDDWPVNLDGLFLPGYADELKMLIPQVRYHVIRTRFLGSDGWDSPDLLHEVKNYVENAAFVTDFHPLTGDSNWSKFARAYQSAYGHAPDKAAATTYDAVQLILAGIARGNKSPEKLRDYLNQIEDYNGISTIVTFKDTDRANNAVGIYSTDGRRLGK